jgi:Na+/H+ antiporter NhaC
METVHTLLYSIVFLFILTSVGNSACRYMFALTGLRTPMDESASADVKAGWVIGGLERLILAIGILTHSWEVLAAVIALKTVARFKELDDKKFSEYFLSGSLFSILWAVLITSLWTLYDAHMGTGTLAALQDLLQVSSKPEIIIFGDLTP